MNPIQFHLTPHPSHSQSLVLNWSVSVTTQKQNNNLQLTYHIQGDIETLKIPEQSATPQAKDNLWQTTCCELFIQDSNSSAYVEINASPSGDWAIYEFGEYRQRGSLNTNIELSSIQINQDTNQMSLTFETSLPVSDSKELLHPTVVLDHQTEKSYWAPKHYSEHPDFHRFVLE